MTKTYDSVAWGEVLVRNAKTGEEGKVEITGIPMTWNPEEISRDAAIYWAVCDAVHEEIKEIDWFSVVSWGCSPSKG